MHNFKMKAPLNVMPCGKKGSAQFLRKLSIASALALAGSFAAAPVAFAQQVTGEITDRKGSAVFQGAMVSLQELGISTATDERGRFRLANIPPGNYTLLISYVGAPPSSHSLPAATPALSVRSQWRLTQVAPLSGPLWWFACKNGRNL